MRRIKIVVWTSLLMFLIVLYGATEKISLAETSNLTTSSSKITENIESSVVEDVSDTDKVNQITQNFFTDKRTGNIETTVSGNTLSIKLTGKPDALSVVTAIYETAFGNDAITSLVIDGEFGLNNSSGSGRQLSATSITSMEIKNSNYLPVQFYMARASKPGKLEKYKDDGSITQMSMNSLSDNGLNVESEKDYNNMKIFESPGLTMIEPGVFERFKGEELILPQLKSADRNGYSNYNNFSNMPNVRKIDLSGLTSLDSYRMFVKMPKLTELKVQSATSLALNGGSFLDASNEAPLFVDMSSLLTIKGGAGKYVYIGSKKSDKPIFVKFGTSHPSMEEYNDYNKDTNAVFYSGTENAKTEYSVNKGESIEISSIADSSFLSYGSKAKIVWYVDGKLSNYTGTRINVNSTTLTEGKHNFKPVFSYNGTEYVDFLGDTNINLLVRNLTLSAEPVAQRLNLGSDASLLSPSLFIKNVKMGDKVLTSSEYKLSFESLPKTDITGKKEVKVKVTMTDSSNKSLVVSSQANVVWGSTIASRMQGGKSGINASVSLLEKNGKPYLNANEGDGFGTGNLYSRPAFSIYHESENNRILNASYGTVNQTPGALASKWNVKFSEIELNYGDVMTYSVRKFSPSTTNEHGENTFISRDNTLTRETLGYDYAYYELTSTGYQLMGINRMKITNDNHVALNTTKEEMNKHIADYIVPSNVPDPEGYRMEFVDVDTETSGKKTSTVNVWEKLKSGGEYRKTYEVNYVVDPTVEESSYDTEGEQLEGPTKTTFEYGRNFTPSPKNYLTKDNDLYIYQGWLENDETPGKDKIKAGIPSPTQKENKYYYIYKKADKFINVTMPTEIVFGTYENTEKVDSKSYEIKNNSSEIKTEVTMKAFEKEKSDVTLLGGNEGEPTKEERSAKLNLVVNETEKIKGLNETVTNETIGIIKPQDIISIGINGKYFGDKKEKNIVDYRMKFIFKAVEK